MNEKTAENVKKNFLFSLMKRNLKIIVSFFAIILIVLFSFFLLEKKKRILSHHIMGD